MTSLKLLLKQTLPSISYSKTKAWKNKLICIPLLSLLANDTFHLPNLPRNCFSSCKNVCGRLGQPFFGVLAQEFMYLVTAVGPPAQQRFIHQAREQRQGGPGYCLGRFPTKTAAKDG
jgi:hypothetical protein